MQQSMTGYGRDQRTIQNLLIKTEVKTLNSKYLDFSSRIPRELGDKEADIRRLIKDSLIRGKVMLNLELEYAEDNVQKVQIDETLFKAYYDKFCELTKSVNTSSGELVKLAFQTPGVIKQQELNLESLPWKEVWKSIDFAVDQCIEFRKKEGKALTDKLNEYIHNIRNGLAHIEKNEDNHQKNIRTKLQKSLDEIKDRVQVDQNRFEQELIFYLERRDISEEKVRLKQHLDYFEEVIQTEENSGKKLDFISQEIRREINTIGSKVNEAKMQLTIVNMKGELEKIKEQILNIL